MISDITCDCLNRVGLVGMGVSEYIIIEGRSVFSYQYTAIVIWLSILLKPLFTDHAFEASQEAFWVVFYG